MWPKGGTENRNSPSLFLVLSEVEVRQALSKFSCLCKVGKDTLFRTNKDNSVTPEKQFKIPGHKVL